MRPALLGTTCTAELLPNLSAVAQCMKAVRMGDLRLMRCKLNLLAQRWVVPRPAPAPAGRPALQGSVSTCEIGRKPSAMPGFPRSTALKAVWSSKLARVFCLCDRFLHDFISAIPWLIVFGRRRSCHPHACFTTSKSGYSLRLASEIDREGAACRSREYTR